MLQDCATDTLAKELAMAVSQSPPPDSEAPSSAPRLTATWRFPELSINGSVHAPRLRPGAHLLEQALRELAA